MKLKEYPDFRRFLETMFEFLRKNTITPCSEPVRNYRKLLANLLDSEFLEFIHHTQDRSYQIKIKYAGKLSEPHVYLFLFGQGGCGCGNHLLIELWGKGDLCFIGVDFMSESHPPFLNAFKNELGKIQVSDGDSTEMIPIADMPIMSTAQFLGFLEANKIQGYLTCIEVE